MASPGSSFWSFGSEDGSGIPRTSAQVPDGSRDQNPTGLYPIRRCSKNPGPIPPKSSRVWCQVAQKFMVASDTSCGRLREAGGERRERAPEGHLREGGLCLQPEALHCPKGNVNYAFLHSAACDGERPTLVFLQDVMDILLQYVAKSLGRSTKVIDFHYLNELLQEYNWELADQPQNLKEILMYCQTTLKYAI